MTPEQIKLIVEAYLKAANRPDGRASTISEYIRYILDGDIDLVTSKDCVILDEEKQLIHAIFVNEDMTAQASFPIKVLSTDFSIIQKIEGVFSQENFEKFLTEGFLADLLSEEKKKFIIDYTRARSNKMQALQPREAEPFFKDNPTIIPMPHKRIEREEYVPIKVMAKNANGESVSFASMNEAFAAVNEGKVNYLKLTDNVSLGNDDAIAVDSGNTVTLNLNGNTIKSVGVPTLFNVSSGSLILEGEGTIEAEGEALRAYSKGSDNASITVGAGISVISNTDCVVYARGKGTTFTSAGNLISNSDTYAAFMGNGTDAGTTINIIGGCIRSANSIALYHPQNGTLNIKDAVISGTTGIYAKAGTVNISGDTKVSGTGIFEAYEFNNDGANGTGDAIVADFCKYPGGYPKFNISGGEFNSVNSKAFECYTKEGQTNPEQAAENINISGGKFNTELNSVWAAEGYAIAKNSANQWTVEELSAEVALTEAFEEMTETSVVTIDETVEAAETHDWFGLSDNFVVTNGGTVTGTGTIKGTEDATFTFVVNNEKNYPNEGDGAYETTIENITIESKSQAALYIQSIDADTHVNDVTITKENSGVGVYTEHGTATTYLDGCNVTVPTTDRTEDERYWLQSAIALCGNSNVVVNSGNYTGRYALYIYSTGGTAVINGGKFTGEIRVDAGNLSITGGEFTFEPKAEWLAEGYTVQHDEATGVYSVVAA